MLHVAFSSLVIYLKQINKITIAQTRTLWNFRPLANYLNCSFLPLRKANTAVNIWETMFITEQGPNIFYFCFCYRWHSAISIHLRFFSIDGWLSKCRWNRASLFLSASFSFYLSTDICSCAAWTFVVLRLGAYISENWNIVVTNPPKV